jgi:hypothetical protein
MPRTEITHTQYRCACGGEPAELGYFGLPTMRSTSFSVIGHIAHDAAPVAINQTCVASCPAWPGSINAISPLISGS